jgi:hypothetical protein
MKKLKRYLAGFFGLVGLNPYAFLSLKNTPRYLVERRKFKKLGGEIGISYPIISEYVESAGTMSGHYYHQDLYVAQKIFENNPQRHLDVGSRIDGFVAHVASFREIEVLDIRPVESKSKNIRFLQSDLMKPLSADKLTDSLSCLHTLEHFGLGRYGDPLDPNGHLKGFLNLIASVKQGGYFYLSFPIGSVERVEFNAHRVFHPSSPLSWPGSEQLKIEDFAFVDDRGDLHENVAIEDAVNANLSYGCGIYTFVKS